MEHRKELEESKRTGRRLMTDVEEKEERLIEEREKQSLREFQMEALDFSFIGGKFQVCSVLYVMTMNQVVVYLEFSQNFLACMLLLHYLK